MLSKISDFFIFDAKKGFILFERKTVKRNDAKIIVFGNNTKNERKGEAFFFFQSEKSVIIRFVSKQNNFKMMQNENLDAKRSEKIGLFISL